MTWTPVSTAEAESALSHCAWQSIDPVIFEEPCARLQTLQTHFLAAPAGFQWYPPLKDLSAFISRTSSPAFLNSYFPLKPYPQQPPSSPWQVTFSVSSVRIRYEVPRVNNILGGTRIYFWKCERETWAKCVQQMSGSTVTTTRGGEEEEEKVRGGKLWTRIAGLPFTCRRFSWKPSPPSGNGPPDRYCRAWPLSSSYRKGHLWGKTSLLFSLKQQPKAQDLVN